MILGLAVSTVTSVSKILYSSETNKQANGIKPPGQRKERKREGKKKKRKPTQLDRILPVPREGLHPGAVLVPIVLLGGIRHVRRDCGIAGVADDLLDDGGGLGSSCHLEGIEFLSHATFQSILNSCCCCLFPRNSYIYCFPVLCNY